MSREWPDIPGWSFDCDRTFLYERVIALQAQVVVEIGVYQGRCTIAIAAALKHTGGICHCVDPWVEPINGADVAWSFLKNVTRYGIEDRIRIHTQSSHQFALRCKPGRVDITWIDGMHTYEAVLEDLQDWAPRSRVVYGHDWDLGGVRQAAQNYAASVGLQAVRLPNLDSVWTLKPLTIAPT